MSRASRCIQFTPECFHANESAMGTRIKERACRGEASGVLRERAGLAADCVRRRFKHYHVASRHPSKGDRFRTYDTSLPHVNLDVGRQSGQFVPNRFMSRISQPATHPTVKAREAFERVRGAELTSLSHAAPSKRSIRPSRQLNFPWASKRPNGIQPASVRAAGAKE